VRAGPRCLFFCDFRAAVTFGPSAALTRRSATKGGVHRGPRGPFADRRCCFCRASFFCFSVLWLHFDWVKVVAWPELPRLADLLPP